MLIFSLCGYGNAITFRNVSDEEIDHVQIFVRNQLVKRLKEECVRRGTEQHTNDGKKNFGIYQDSVEQFEFLMGDRATIREIVHYVSSYYAEHGPKKFAEYFAPPDGYEVSKTDTSVFPAGQFFGKIHRNVEKLKVASFARSLDTNDLSVDLFKKLKPILEDFATKVKIVRPINQDIIKVVELSNGFRADVLCVFCLTNDSTVDKSLNTTKSVQWYRRSPTNYKWNYTNFQHHLKTHVKPKPNSTEKNRTEKNKTDFQSSHDLHIENEFSIPNDCSSSEIQKKNTFTAEECNMNAFSALKITVDSKKGFKSILEQKINHGNNNDEAIEILDSSDNNTNANTELYVQTYNELYNQFSAQNDDLIESVLKNNETKTHVAIEFEGQQVIVGIVNIAPDGNCLFGSLAFQLDKMKIDSESHRNFSLNLRQRVVKHIKENYDDFKQRIKGTVYDMAERRKIAVVDIDTECDTFMNNLGQLGCWAGQETIKAISEIFSVNIVVIKENHGPYFGVIYNPIYKKTIFLAYQQGANDVHNHYAGVCELSKELIDNMARYFSEQYLKNLELDLENENKPGDGAIRVS